MIEIYIKTRLVFAGNLFDFYKNLEQKSAGSFN